MAKTDGGPSLPVEDSLARDMERAQLAAQAMAIDLIRDIYAYGETIRPIEREREKAKDALRQYMGLEGLDSLHDEERGLTATLSERHSTPTYDLVALVEHGFESAIIEAAKAGMLRVDGVALDRFRKNNGASWADAVNRVKMPGSISSVLTVSEGDKR